MKFGFGFFAVAALAAVACGDDETTTSSAATTTVAATTTAGTGGSTTSTGGSAATTTSTGGTGGTGGTAATGGTGGGSAAAMIVSCDSSTPATTIDMILPDFMPDTATVAVGDVIEFANTDTVSPHTSTSGTVMGMMGKPDGNWDTGSVMPGASACVRFLAAGDYPFYCALHPTQMQGTITVQ